MRTLSSRIESVVVYREGALVSRVALLGPEGVSGARCRIPNLPLSMDDGSLRLEVQGEGPLPTVVEAKVHLEPGSADPELAPARNEALDAAHVEHRLRSVALEQIDGELARIRTLAPTARPEPEEGQPPVPPPVQARLDLLTFRDQRVALLLDERAEADRALRAAVEHLQHLQAEAQRASNAREARDHELRKSVLVGMEGPAPTSGDTRLVMHYLVPGARWTPAYTLRLDGRLEQAELEVRAQVRQRTGEDWEGARLVLSTAAAQSWVELPQLKALRIGRRQPSPKSTWRPPPTGAGALYGDFDLAFPPEPIVGGAARAMPTSRAEGRKVERIAPPEPEPAMDLMADELLDLEEAEATWDDMAVAGGAVPASQAMAPPAPMQAKSSGMLRSRASAAPMRRSKKRRPSAPPPPPVLEADPQLQDYGRLRMPSADGPRRGQLVRLHRQELIIEMVQMRRVHIALSVIDAAVGDAQDIAHQPPPAGHTFPTSVGGFDHAYPVEHPVDVPSDGAFHSLIVGRSGGPAEPRYVCVPRETQDVFRQVELKNPLSAPVLGGPVDIYVDGAYLLTAPMRPTPARGTVRLGLGVEQAVKVARNVRYEEERAGILKGHLELSHHISVELANRLERSARIEIRERVPVSGEDDDDVKVAVGAVTPSWESWEPDESPLPGGKRWVVEVPAGEDRTLQANYTIHIPPKHELVGGNRREV